jgi:Tissue inhibitor of metalloproteinase
MRRTTVTLLLSGLLLAAGLLVATPASACSCVGGTPQEFFDRADAVFTARLVSREEPRGRLTSSADPALHVFAVDTVFKGTAHEQQGVVSPVSGATCGLELSGEGPFVVFATRSADLGGMRFTSLADDQYAAFLCGGTTSSTPALEAELAALAGFPPATPAAPLPGAAGTVPPGTNLLAPGLLGTGALLLALGGMLVLRHRRAGR